MAKISQLDRIAPTGVEQVVLFDGEKAARAYLSELKLDDSTASLFTAAILAGTLIAVPIAGNTNHLRVDLDTAGNGDPFDVMIVAANDSAAQMTAGGITRDIVAPGAVPMQPGDLARGKIATFAYSLAGGGFVLTGQRDLNTGFQPKAKSPIGGLTIEDKYGRAALVEQDDGSMLIGDLRRPTPTGQVAVGAELDSLDGLGRSIHARALVKAMRAWSLYPAPTFRLADVDRPTMILGATNGTSDLTADGNFNIGPASSKLTWPCGYLIASGYGNLGYQSSSGLYTALEFNAAGTQFDVQISCSEAPLYLIVDGILAGTVTIRNEAQNFAFLRVAFPTARKRRILLMTAVPLRALAVADPAEITSVGREYPLVSIIGDSFAEGTGADNYFVGQGAIVGRALGCSVGLHAAGGTGLLNPGDRVNWMNPTRLADLTYAGRIDPLTGTPIRPSLGLVMGTINDSSAVNRFHWPAGSTDFLNALKRAIFIQIDAWLAENAGKPLVYFGPTWPNGFPGLEVHRIRDMYHEAVWEAGGPSANIHFVDRLGPKPILREGDITDPASTANLYGSYSVDGGQDPTHPNQLGHNLDGLWEANALKRLILAEIG